MENGFDFLLNRMKSSRPVLLLGAGFSLGAVNAKKVSLPAGRELAKNLYEHFFADRTTTGLDAGTLREITAAKEDLKELCYYLRLLGKVKERNAFLTQTFQGCSVPYNSYHNKLTNYEWEYIFTLNIDDLVEDIYRRAGKSLSIWDQSHLNGNVQNATTNLIKLHGSVGDFDSGYIFDNEEYRLFSIEANSLLKEFAHQALQHDLVLIGTKFQEEDLQTILDIYERSGYSKTPFYCFFILPELSGKLQLQMQRTANCVWISADAKTFLERLNAEIVIPNQEKDRLKEKGSVFLDEVNRNTPPSYDLYKGLQTSYVDFFHNADIFPQELSKWREELLSSNPRILMVLYGESYIGKTCFAKRLLVELSKEGYTAFQLNRLDDDVFDLLNGYLQKLPIKSKVTLFADNASYHYSRFLEVKNNCPKNVEKLVIILEDMANNHQGKEYLLLEDPDSILHSVSSKMNQEYAMAIFNTLSRKHRLNKYLKLLPNKTNPFSRRAREIIIPKIAQENDIIDALYYSTEGEPFQRHYSRWLQANTSDMEKRVLYSLCYLYRLGITRIPNPLVTRLGQNCDTNFRLSDFIRKYSDVLSVYYGWMSIHRGRILNSLIGTDDVDLIIQTLRTVALYAVPSNERLRGDLTSVFERSIRVKRIRNTKLLTRKQILTLLKGLEDTCRHISYFWVQFGIAAQINNEFEDASNHLCYAQSMRPNSYHVNHALAKNELEWGLHLIKEGIGDGNSKFMHGAEVMYEIAKDGKFSKNFRYSVHTYVSMWLDYAKISDVILQRETIKTCATLLEDLLEHPLDNMLTGLIKTFIAYCKDNGMSDLCGDLNLVYHRPERFRVEEETYDIE